MNTTVFNAGRFALLARAQWAERWRGWAVFLLVGTLLYALLLGLVLTGSEGSGLRTSDQASYFFVGWLLSGAVFAGQYFAALRRPESSLLLLMRPATAFEKWLLAALVVLLAYPLAYALVVSLLHLPAAALAYQIRLTHEAQALASDYAVFSPLGGHANEAAMGSRARLAWAVMYVGLTGYVLACSIWFKRSAGLKALVLGFAVFLCTSLVLSVPGARVNALLGWFSRAPLPHDGNALYWLANALLWIGVPLLLWLAALQALRERDLA
ncbi:hypothetical protein [Ottowia testudinis]|uniref:Uncharacterized protein n=1 Tax=Ottowia testudinis TaxID=2816950 RepID=A0A975CEP9_9BURK|nr:hypothetical protein [Ottowia testudinis]QTD45068.1 hypothetical protein J1M35_18895 [Ottowia testudinis]